MAKFAGKSKGKGPKGKTTNYEGGEAFSLDDESTLLNLVSTCMMNEPKFYGDVGETEEKIFDLAKKVDPRFVLQLGAYTRTELYLRSVPMFLLSVAANRNDGKPFVREYTPKIVNRADELYESMACYKELFGKPFPNSLKKGIGDAFGKFDEYQFGKYNRKTEMSFKDVMCIAHPKEPKELLQKIHDGTLATPMTWETEISGKGNKPEVWQALIDAKKLPYMATLRNLRNLLTTGGTGVDDEHLDKVIAYLGDPDAVRKSKQFPFRFYSAYKQLAGSNSYYDETKVTHSRVSDVLDAIEEAIYVSYENIPHMDGTTLIACDVSGSMDSPISGRSQMKCIDIGVILGSAMHKYCDRSIFGVFGTDWMTMNIPKKSAGIIANVPKIIHKAQKVGWSTNGHKIIQWLNSEKKKVDRLFIFTDMQLWNTSTRMGFGSDRGATLNNEYVKYKKNVNPNVKMYLFNLQGYGTTVAPESDKSVTNINGWSDKVLQFIQLNEQDPKAQVNYIKEKY